MKKFLAFLFIFFIMPISLNASSLNITSDYVYFYQLDKKELLYEQNKATEISIASMTKIMTAYVAIENIENLDATVILTYKDFKGLVEENASTAGFVVGEKVTYRDLLYGLMLPSGADAALALSNNIAGSEEKFVDLMNKKASELNLQHTNFANTTGLDHRGHYSSVEDVATFLIAALNNKTFYEIFTSKKYTTSNNRLIFKSTLSKNSDTYNIDTSYIIGSKSGYTYDAGLCLASIAEHDGSIYLLVTAGADYKSSGPNHIYDSNTVYKYFFEGYSYKEIMIKGDLIVSIVDENDEYKEYFIPYTKEMYLPNDVNISSKYNGISLLTYDMNIGDKLGSYEIYIDGELVESIDILLENKIVKPFPLEQTVLAFVIIFIIIVSIFVLLKLKKNKKRRKRRK